MKYNDMQVAVKAKSCAAFGLMIFVEIKFDMIYIFGVSFYLMVFQFQNSNENVKYFVDFNLITVAELQVDFISSQEIAGYHVIPQSVT